jgi:pimeloyl-ACP methyl ester carboxylesterase
MAKIEVNGIQMHYQVVGQGEPLVFIHGLGSSSRDWEFQADHFYRDYRVVVFDARGHGQSEKPPGPYSIPLFAQDTAALIRVLELAPAHVVGISMGGMIAFQLALDAPELLRSLVIVNSWPEMVVRTWRQRLQIWQRDLIVGVLGMRKMGEVLAGRLFPKEEQAEIRAVFVERWTENDKRAYQDAMHALVGWSVSERLEEITCPVLVVAADQDYTPVETKAAYTRRLPQAELVVIEDSRHATPAEQPQKFNQVLGAFLKNKSLVESALL